jgi:hypothetical protein
MLHHKGDMDEQTRKNVRTASKVSYASTNDRAYQNEVVFKCK